MGLIKFLMMASTQAAASLGDDNWMLYDDGSPMLYDDGSHMTYDQ
jgi:hypothetical protein